VSLSPVPTNLLVTADRPTDIIVLFPFHIPISVPRPLANFFLDALSALRIIPPRQDPACNEGSSATPTHYVRIRLHLDFVTAPLIADLFLLAIRAIGKEEVHDGTIGAEGISPIDIMLVRYHWNANHVRQVITWH
jgi:hypothetical protein